MWSPYQLQAKDYVPVIKRRPESHLKPRIQEWGTEVKKHCKQEFDIHKYMMRSGEQTN
jgi:hypothetical protein